MSIDMSEDESDVELYPGATSSPSDPLQLSNICSSVLLPAKSKQRYETMYQFFEKWQVSNSTNLFSEDVLLTFFRELSATKSPSTLWSSFSMLKSMIKQQRNIDIGKYSELLAFLKDRSKGYITAKAKVFTDDEIAKFISEAPDSIYLATKVVLIFGLMGACRTYELVNMSVHHIETHGRLFLVKIPKTESSTARTFTISDHYFDIVEKYQKLRPHYVQTNRFFLNYQKGKCTAQVIGKHKFAKMPRQIAEFLQLEDANGYTGHSFRRTSTTLLANISTDLILKRCGRAWKSASMTESCHDDDLRFKRRAETLGRNHKNERSSSNNPGSILNRIRDREESRVETAPDFYLYDGREAGGYGGGELRDGLLGEPKVEALSVGSHESYLEEEAEEYLLPRHSFEQPEISVHESDMESVSMAVDNHADTVRDEFRIFGRSVAVELQKLPARDAILAKSEIQATLTRYRLKNTPP